MSKPTGPKIPARSIEESQRLYDSADKDEYFLVSAKNLLSSIWLAFYAIVRVALPVVVIGVMVDLAWTSNPILCILAAGLFAGWYLRDWL